MMIKNILPFLLIVITVSSAFSQDVLTLNNEMRFAGTIKKIKDCSLIFKADGEKFEIPVDDIYSIQFEDVGNPIYTDYLAQSSARDNCLKASVDANLYHGKKGSHVLLGFLFGPFAMIGTALASPNPYNGKQTIMLSQNPDLFSDAAYLSCYKKKAKRQLIVFEGIGWLGAILLALATS